MRASRYDSLYLSIENTSTFMTMYYYTSKTKNKSNIKIKLNRITLTRIHKYINNEFQFKST